MDTDAEANGPVHVAAGHYVAAAPVHAGVYGYTPAPAVYGPVEPVYHTTPVYTPEAVYGATPVVHHADPAAYHEVPAHAHHTTQPGSGAELAETGDMNQDKESESGLQSYYEMTSQGDHQRLGLR